MIELYRVGFSFRFLFVSYFMFDEGKVRIPIRSVFIQRRRDLKANIAKRETIRVLLVEFIFSLSLLHLYPCLFPHDFLVLFTFYDLLYTHCRPLVGFCLSIHKWLDLFRIFVFFCILRWSFNLCTAFYYIFLLFMASYVAAVCWGKGPSM